MTEKTKGRGWASVSCMPMPIVHLTREKDGQILLQVFESMREFSTSNPRETEIYATPAEALETARNVIREAVSKPFWQDHLYEVLAEQIRDGALDPE